MAQSVMVGQVWYGWVGQGAIRYGMVRQGGEASHGWVVFGRSGGFRCDWVEQGESW